MSRYYLKGKKPGDEVVIGVGPEAFFVHYNEDKVQSAFEDGRVLDESKGWIKDFYFFEYDMPLLEALEAARTVAEVDDELAAIIREDYRQAIGQRQPTPDHIAWLTAEARKRPGVGSASFAGV